MSLLTYISFPREVNTSCIISKTDKSKVFNVGEIRGTELEKQIKCDINKIPNKFNIYLGEASDWRGLSVLPFDKGIFTFNNVFTNQFIYILYSYMPPFRSNFPNNSDDADMDDNLKKIRKEAKDNVAVCRQQLYDIVRLNIKPDEIVEIYSEWANIKNIYGPPVEKISINTEQIFTTTLLDLQQRIKN